jgi:hypothetical protein
VASTSEDFASELDTPTGEPSAPVQAYVEQSSSSIAAEPWTSASQPYAAYPTEPQPVMSSGSITAPASTASDDPLAPLPSSDHELRASASIIPSRSRNRRPPTEDELSDDEDGGNRSGSNKILMVSLFAGVLAVGIAVMVIFGTINKHRYVISCEPDEVVAGQGRGFPPWGTRALEDAQWKAMKIPPEAECKERETEDENELSGWYLEMLEGRASVLLQAPEVTKLDEAAGLLEQALLHARSPDRRDARAKIERMLGDVQYWRASAKLRDAATALTEAAKQFDAASQQIPRYVKDASAWAIYVRKLVEELQAGPTGASNAAFPPTPPAQERPGAPPGVALPVEPDRAGSGSDSEPAPPAAPPDAGIPTGGVLL